MNIENSLVPYKSFNHFYHFFYLFIAQLSNSKSSFVCVVNIIHFTLSTDFRQLYFRNLYYASKLITYQFLKIR